MARFYESFAESSFKDDRLELRQKAKWSLEILNENHGILVLARNSRSIYFDQPEISEKTTNHNVWQNNWTIILIFFKLGVVYKCAITRLTKNNS